MFVALRDIKFAKGRFALIGTVVALITLLVGFLTGLAAGLGNQNISSILDMKASTIVFSSPDDDETLDWNSSSVTPEMVKQWSDAPGVEQAVPLGIQRAKASVEKDAGVVLFGTPKSEDVAGEAPSGNGMVILSSNAAEDLQAVAGDKVTLGTKSYVIEQVSTESWYEHAPIIHMTLDDLAYYNESVGQTDSYANVILVEGNPEQGFDSLNDSAGTVSKSKLSSLAALEIFKSEVGSLGLMIGMLVGISALVIGAFFTVWTIQRKPDVAVLKALGTSTKALLKDSLTQAFIILVAGIGAGVLVTIVFGTLAGQTLPFVMNIMTLGIPAVLMLITGLAGAAFALRSVVTADPLSALNASR